MADLKSIAEIADFGCPFGGMSGVQMKALQEHLSG
jgi:hypothetical protein